MQIYLSNKTEVALSYIIAIPMQQSWSEYYLIKYETFLKIQENTLYTIIV